MGDKTFISYARKDGDFARRLAHDLREANVELWMDQLDIRPGDTWDRAVEEALQECTGLLVVLSPAAVESRSVMDEVSYALEENRRVIPVICSECRLPFRLRRVQYTDMTADYDRGLSALIRVLGGMPPAAAEERAAGADEPSPRVAESPVPAPASAPPDPAPPVTTPASATEAGLSRAVEDPSAQTAHLAPDPIPLVEPTVESASTAEAELPHAAEEASSPATRLDPEPIPPAEPPVEPASAAEAELPHAAEDAHPRIVHLDPEPIPLVEPPASSTEAEHSHVAEESSSPTTFLDPEPVSPAQPLVGSAHAAEASDAHAVEQPSWRRDPVGLMQGLVSRLPRPGGTKWPWIDRHPRLAAALGLGLGSVLFVWIMMSSSGAGTSDLLLFLAPLVGVPWAIAGAIAGLRRVHLAYAVATSIAGYILVFLLFISDGLQGLYALISWPLGGILGAIIGVVAARHAAAADGRKSPRAAPE